MERLSSIATTDPNMASVAKGKLLAKAKSQMPVAGTFSTIVYIVNLITTTLRNVIV